MKFIYLYCDLSLENKRAELKCQCATWRKNNTWPRIKTVASWQAKARFRIYKKEHS